MIKTPSKPKNYQNTSEIQKMTKIPLETQKMTPETKKITKIPPNPKNDQNTPKTQKITKIPLKPKK